MSVTAIGWAWKQAIPRNLLPELLALADNTNDLGICWVRISTLAAKTKTTERTAQRNIGALMELGLLSVIERRIKGSGNRCNLYLLPVPGVDPAQQREFISEMTTGTQAVKRTKQGGEGDTSVTQGGVTPTSPRGDTSVTHNCKKELIPNVLTRGGSNQPQGEHYLPADWIVPDDINAKLLADGYKQDQIDDQAEMFRIYWHEQAERNTAEGKKKSWKMTFVNWIKRAGKEKAGPERPTDSHYKPNRGNYGSNPRRQSTGADLIGQLADRANANQGRQPESQDEFIDAQYTRQ